jgi:hypothetical protein
VKVCGAKSFSNRSSKSPNRSQEVVLYLLRGSIGRLNYNCQWRPYEIYLRSLQDKCSTGSSSRCRRRMLWSKPRRSLFRTAQRGHRPVPDYSPKKVYLYMGINSVIH